MFYASHNWQPFFLQGTKTLAYELWEDLGFRAPDNVIIPTGAGSNVLGCDIGFGELLRRGAIARLPRLFAAQPANCAPIHASFIAGGDTLVAVDAEADHRRRHRHRQADPSARGARRAPPLRRRDRRRERGRDRRGLARTRAATASTPSRPARAAAAACSKLIADGMIKPGQTTVVVLTGSGLKATQRIGEVI